MFDAYSCLFHDPKLEHLQTNSPNALSVQTCWTIRIAMSTAHHGTMLEPRWATERDSDRGTIFPGADLVDAGLLDAQICPVNKRLLWHSTNWPSIYQLRGPARRASMLRFPQRRELTFAGHCQRRNTLEVKLKVVQTPRGPSKGFFPNPGA